MRSSLPDFLFSEKNEVSPLELIVDYKMRHGKFLQFEIFDYLCAHTAIIHGYVWKKTDNDITITKLNGT